jgi:hypothetical protein
MDSDNVFLNKFAVPTMKYEETYQDLMTDEIFDSIQTEITKEVNKAFPNDKPVIVTRRVIKQALEYAIVNRYSYNFNYYDVIHTVINSFVQQIIDEKTTIEQNDKLDIWIQKYDGTKGLRGHSTIRLNDKGVSVPVSFMGRY